jgi:pyruvate/2-oxoglutarate dehydrogenase complex dihydrolipoamide dehydrogenase (E3) component
MAAMRETRDTVAHHDDPARFRALGVDVIAGSAELVSAGTVRVGDRVLHSKRVVIATGASPAAPPIPGLAQSGFLTHRTLLQLTEAPGPVAVIGGGPIGIEFAQILQRFRIPVTVFELLPSILGREDADAGAVVRASLEAEGVVVHTRASILGIERSGPDRIVVWRRGDGPQERTTVAQILVAVGRQPNIEGLGLERVGIATQRGGVRVDRRLATSLPGTWAAGDVTGGMQFTHFADYQARLVVRNALTPFPASADYRAVPRVTFSDPELAAVGLTHEEALQAGLAPRVWRYDFADLDRAITDRRREGFVKLVTGRDGRVLGGTIVGQRAGELLAPVILAVQRRLPLSALASFVYPYPTLSEGVKRAAELAQRARLDSFAGRLLRKLVRWRL